MKDFCLFLIIVLLTISSIEAQVQTRFSESTLLDESGVFGVESLGTVTTLPRVDASTLMMEDAEQELMAVPFRFGYAMDVKYSVSNSGRWFDKPEGRLWKLN